MEEIYIIVVNFNLNHPNERELVRRNMRGGVVGRTDPLRDATQEQITRRNGDDLRRYDPNLSFHAYDLAIMNEAYPDERNGQRIYLAAWDQDYENRPRDFRATEVLTRCIKSVCARCINSENNLIVVFFYSIIIVIIKDCFFG